MHPHEQAWKPDSLQHLTKDAAEHLKAYMDTAAGLKVPRVIHGNAVVLWIVDEDGEIHVAMEELFHEKAGVLATVRPRADWVKIANTVKLGHPSLVEGDVKNARIGGEIVYDAGAARWEINNFSGRFGMRKWQEKRHLEAVAGKFNTWNIHLYVKFRKPREE